MIFWTCLKCGKTYAVELGYQIECRCDMEFVPAPIGTQADESYPGPTFIHRRRGKTNETTYYPHSL